MGSSDNGDHPIPDGTLGGYLEEHDRPPAFTGPDGQPYTVAVDSETTGKADPPFAAYLIFLRWAPDGAAVVGHLTSPDLAHGATAEQACARVLRLSLHEVKAALDQAVERRIAETG